MKPKRIEECGCCEVGIPPTPEEIKNRPGLSKIAYRVGTYASFRQAMIEAIAKSPELKDWTARQSREDYGIALIEMWAYIADILTFYQERIANEAFLRTALHRDTIMKLAAMLDYRLNPGVAATTYLAFFLESNAKVNIPSGMRVQSVPGQDEKPQKFETVEAVEAFSSLNEIRLKSTEPQTISKGRKRLVLKGVNTGLKVGDYILVVGEERKGDPGSERWDLRKISSLTIDSKRQTTTIDLDEVLGHSRVDFPKKDEKIEVFAMSLKVWPFGVNAPDYKLLSAELKQLFNVSWTNKMLPEDSAHPNHIYLDNVYDTIKPDSWIALVTTKPPSGKPQYPGYTEVYLVKDVDNTVAINYTLTSQVTRLTVDGIEDSKKLIQPEHINYFPMQGTMILAQSEPLEVADILITEPLTGKTLVLDQYYPDLKSGRTLIVRGELSSSTNKEAVEVVQISEVAHLTQTTLTLKTDLKYSYKPATVRIYSNAAKATHGETVSDEVLGSSDASLEFQLFTLKRSPTTFVSAPDAPRGSKNTLLVRIGGVEWKEVESLYGQNFNERVYITRVSDEGKMSVQFGDGKTGARLPTGQDNVVARYRQGLGNEGKVPAKSLTTLLNRPIGLKSVTNPREAEGGTDPESLNEARTNAPNTVRTFERAVSLRDYEDLARSYTGIAKAKAARIFKDGNESVQLTIAGQNGQKIEPTFPVYKDFIDYLNLHRDINLLLNVISHTKIPLVLKAILQVDPAYLKEDVISAARTAVLNYFNFNNLDLGQGIHLSDIYAVLQAVEGVTATVIEHLDYYKESSSPTLNVHLRIEPSQIAALEEEADLKLSSDFTERG